jgi:hypothetical protein
MGTGARSATCSQHDPLSIEWNMAHERAANAIPHGALRRDAQYRAPARRSVASASSSGSTSAATLSVERDGRDGPFVFGGRPSPRVACLPRRVRTVATIAGHPVAGQVPPCGALGECLQSERSETWTATRSGAPSVSAFRPVRVPVPEPVPGGSQAPKCAELPGTDTGTFQPRRTASHEQDADPLKTLPRTCEQFSGTNRECSRAGRALQDAAMSVRGVFAGARSCVTRACAPSPALGGRAFLPARSSAMSSSLRAPARIRVVGELRVASRTAGRASGRVEAAPLAEPT